MTDFKRILSALLIAVLVTMSGGCSDDDDDNGGTTSVNLNREYVQIERLGNPLVSEVFLAKRQHGTHNASIPSQDVSLYKQEMEDFVEGFGRPPIVGTTLTGVLLPDMLIVDSSKSTTSAGWLSNALSGGYGGRKLTDDVVDTGLSAIFGTALSATGAIPALASDNVDANDKSFGNTFPYLATPH
ncbi:MAG TPA: DUF4331 family protein [Candidatus Eisenbacteria bacterium]